MNLEIEEMCARLENSTRDVLAIVARNQIATVHPRDYEATE